MARGSRLLRSLAAASAALALAALLAGAAAARAQDEPPSPAAEPDTNATLMDRSDLGNVAEAGRQLYHAGVREAKRAEKLAEKAAEIDDADKRAKQHQKARAAYETAAENLVSAIRTQPKLFEAYAELAAVYMRLARYPEALQVQDAALRLEPGDASTLAARGETYLALNYLREAAQTYTELRESHPQEAGELMRAMKRWVEQKRADPGGINPEAVEILATWIDQQEPPAG